MIYNAVMVIYYIFNKYNILSQREENSRENMYNRYKHMYTIIFTSLYYYKVIKIYQN